ncbi:large conductance mechanosensitive channel protein MscL [Pedomonas mirosovicensis]|uniref:large conductance mechanosensitive channel protein MscL n=1 Tax=Pedomonas mirosovicensis TaxID=2908641 RepID=UPI00216880B8|nr:large conductance mechanosensitive channel protein MscL [Pedomonas mirosovicensis]MCH8685431.1 large conductance mechanosensitive channel protein MscL [Pedomonas mirosovicensis]
MFKEFKEFALRGNVLDLAVGVIIGAAFNKIIDSVVKDLIMPIVSALFGTPDFSNLYLVLGSIPADYAGSMAYKDLVAAGVPVLGYGQFITVAINFILLAFVVFWIVKGANALSRPAKKDEAPAAPPPPPEDIQLLREIRDALKAKS